MFRFERRAAVIHAADMPAAVQFAGEVSSYLNKRHSLNMKVGVELFGTGTIHWYYDLESLDKSVQLNATLLQDRDYIEMVNKARGLFVDGSFRDTIVTLLG
jgi:hypothetical protein